MGKKSRNKMVLAKKEIIIKTYVFLISFKKERLSKKVLPLLYYQQTLCPLTVLYNVIQIAFLNLFKSTWKESFCK